MKESDNNPIKTFDCFGNPESTGLRWKRWLSGFELFADSKGLIVDAGNATVKQRRRALLLHIAGSDVQDIFATLPDTGEVTDYKKAVDALNLYFILKVDTTHQRHCFRKLSQAPGETVRQFAARLRRSAKDCNCREETENQIRDEILCRCPSSYIKRKLIEEGQGLSLARALEIADNCEKVNSQIAAMSSTKQDGIEVVNYTKQKKGNRRDKKLQVSHDKTCYRCGKPGHFAKDSSCETSHFKLVFWCWRFCDGFYPFFR